MAVLIAAAALTGLALVAAIAHQAAAVRVPGDGLALLDLAVVLAGLLLVLLWPTAAAALGHTHRRRPA